MNGILQLRRGGTKRKAPSKSFREKKKAQFKQRKKDELEKIVSSKSADNTSGIAGITITGKDSENREVKDIIPSNIPDDLVKFINRNRRDDGSLNSAAQRIIDEYSKTAVNPYAERMQRFKESPGGIEAFKERFPNPLVKAARGIGDFFREGTALGKILSALKPSDKKKAEIITEESRRVPYDPSQFGLGKVYDDKILRDQLGMSYQDSLREIAKRNTIDPYGEPDMLGITAPRLSGITDANKRQIVESYFKKSFAGASKEAIDKAYNFIQTQFAERKAIAPETADKRAMDDFTNFQTTNEEVVDEATGTGDPGDQLRFELGGSDLSGSVSETDYSGGGMEGNQAMADLDQMGLAVPDPVLPNQFDIITGSGNPAYSDVRGQDYNALMNEFNNAEQKNMGGYMGMSTFDKLKMIADGIADNK
jgi:hypothetical protein